MQINFEIGIHINHMKATETLSSEHRVIEQVLTALQTGIWLLSQDETIRSDFFMDVTDFLMEYADHYHHQKEEGYLAEKQPWIRF